MKTLGFPYGEFNGNYESIKNVADFLIYTKDLDLSGYILLVNKSAGRVLQLKSYQNKQEKSTTMMPQNMEMQKDMVAIV